MPFSTPSSVQKEELPDRIAALTDKLKAAEKQLADFKKQQLQQHAGTFVDNASTAGAFTVIAEQLEGLGGADLRQLATDLKNRLGDLPGVVVLGSDDAGKAPFVVGVTAEGVSRGVKAGDLVKLMSRYVDGRGGGKPDMAQGSGSEAGGFAAAFDAVKQDLSAR